jgi:glycerol dehydrogenase
MTYSFESPAAYVQGRGAIEGIGERAASLGGTALVIGDEVVLGIVEERVRDSLDAAGVEIVVEEFGGECSTSEIERVSEVASDVDAEVIVGAGGGKTLDTAKAVREELGMVLVTMPTIASTDAPTSSLSVIYSEEGEFEEYWFHESHPDLVLVDTDVIAGAPTRFFRSGIADAMATWFEGEAVHRAGGENFFGEEPTNAAYRLCSLCYDLLGDHGRSALTAVERGVVTEAVEAVTEANTLLSGLGFESGGIAAAHSVHNGLTQLEATHDATHGEKVNLGTTTQLILEGRPDEFVEEVIDFSLDLGLPVTLEELGVSDPSEKDPQRVAEAALAPEETIHNAFDVSVPELRDAMIVADELGRERLDKG